MALNKDVLGTALYNARAAFNDKSIDTLVATYGSLEGVRLAMAKVDADEIIKHFIANIAITIPATGLVAPGGGGAVTGSAVTGSIT